MISFKPARILQLGVPFGIGTLFVFLGMSCANGSSPAGILGKKLYANVASVEGPVPAPVAFEKSKLCTIYQCVRSNGIGDTKTGSYSWLLLNKGVNSVKALQESSKGAYFPEVTLSYENNVIAFADILLGSKPQKSLPASTLNMMVRFSELVSTVPVSSQKIAACYGTLQKEARCTVLSGSVKANDGRIHPFEAAFRTTDDGLGDSTVNYAIGFTD